MEKCQACKWAMQNLCQGGCIGYTILRNNEEILEKEPDNHNGVFSRRLTLSGDTKVRNYSLPRETIVLQKSDSLVDVAIAPQVWSLIKKLNGYHTVVEAVSIVSYDTVDLSSNDPIDCFISDQTRSVYYPWVKKLYKHGFLTDV